MDETPEEAVKYSPRSTYRMCEDMSDMVLDLLTDTLLMEANLTDSGQLEREEIAKISREFKNKQKNDYLRKVQRIAEEWLAQVEKNHWSHNRKRPFERIMVKRFSHLFPPSESLANKHAVSRRALGGIFEAFRQLAGHEFMDQCQGAGRGILKRVMEGSGDAFLWDEYYDDLSANDLVDDLMAVVAWSFTDTAARVQWMLNLVNNNLSPPEDYAFEGEEVFNWTLSEKGLIEILRSLFANFKEKLANDGSRREIEMRYGQKAGKATEDVVRQLDKM